MTSGSNNESDMGSVDRLLQQLQERAKELNCLYRVDEALATPDADFGDVAARILEAIPPGWQYPSVCVSRITIDDKVYQSPDFRESEWVQSAVIKAGDQPIGKIEVVYTREMPKWDDGPFLKEETRLIRTIADRIGHSIMHRKMRSIVAQWEERGSQSVEDSHGEWRVVLQMLRQTDRNLYVSVARKMLNHLCWSGVAEADKLMQTFTPDPRDAEDAALEEWNQPYERRQIGFSSEIIGAVFKIASEHLSDREVFRLVQKWIQEDKLSFLVQVVNRNLSLGAVADAIRRYHHLAEHDTDIQSPNRRGIEVSLIRRILSDQLQYINVAKDYIGVSDFHDLMESVIFAAESHGKLGGKSAGMYLAARILEKESADDELLGRVKIPKTFFITSDVLLHYMHFNNFDEIVEQKYKPINQVRFEYPYIVQTFKNARFPADIENGLSVALDEFGEQPLIVRSSSLLEDRIGASFSGKYKSLFLANQGSKKRRLDALKDAIAEVYASTFGPDPIEYRAERGLLDFGEEMGIMIQEVVGTKAGKYFTPSFAGVAFSRNEFRWSPRIKREDGLIRLVPGLGTRAVDRLSEDYPVLIAPGQPNLNVNATPDERARYSPQKLDVLNLETNAFETVDFRSFMRQIDGQLPAVEQMVSIYRDGELRAPGATTNVSEESDDVVVTFEHLVSRTSFVVQVKRIVETLEDKLGMPVDIEFAHDGRNLYLLQCRSQSHSELVQPAPIPKGTPQADVLFTANRYISNGLIPNLTHLVYVVPERYSELPDRNAMLEVGRAVGFLNKVLPKRQFALIGPGRWGSRGDIKLGVSVTYSDINNTAILIEVARKKGNYTPDLSFGTHFFQDLVEAGIRYLPLYPDDKDVVFNERFLLKADNLLAELAPDYGHLSPVLRLIDVSRSTNGRVAGIFMNSDLDEAMGIVTESASEPEAVPRPATEVRTSDDRFWQWRLKMVEKIAASLDAEKLGVVNMYVFGSTKNASAGPASDIDLLLHFRGSSEQYTLLQTWLDGWSLCLAETNYLQTGYRSDGLLDVHIVTDEDIEQQSSWAAKIGAVTDAARPIPLRKDRQ